jgi:hypothetical protein
MLKGCEKVHSKYFSGSPPESKSTTVGVQPKSEFQKSRNSSYFELIIIDFESASTALALSNLTSNRFSSQYGLWKFDFGWTPTVVNLVGVRLNFFYCVHKSFARDFTDFASKNGQKP